MNNPNPYDELLEALKLISARPDIQTEETAWSGVHRVKLTRRLSDGTSRYILLRHARRQDGAATAFNVYAASYGVFGHPTAPPNFDAKSWGDLRHVVDLARAFLVDLSEPSQLPRFQMR